MDVLLLKIDKDNLLDCVLKKNNHNWNYFSILNE